MPDDIPFKGMALAMMAGAFFERLKREFPEIKTHYRGLIDLDGIIRSVDKLMFPSNEMLVDLVRVIRPNFVDGLYDYSPLIGEDRNYLTPLELIYRNSLPKGASIFKRLESGEVDYYRDLGLKCFPDPGQVLPRPFFEVTTKLEETDRHIGWKEAMEISGLNSDEMREIKIILANANSVISEMAAEAGLKNEDGKIEVAKGMNREMMMVDVAGTLDECRFTFEGTQISKEMLRTFYAKSDWKKEVDRAKSEAERLHCKDWRQLCNLQPEPLPKEWIDIVSNAYQVVTNLLVKKTVFANVPTLREITEDYQRLCQSL